MTEHDKPTREEMSEAQRVDLQTLLNEFQGPSMGACYYKDPVSGLMKCTQMTEKGCSNLRGSWSGGQPCG